jgi:hypothetical protein
MLMMGAIEPNGSLFMKKVPIITKDALWNYVFYLQNYNRSHPSFSIMGKSKTVTDSMLLSLIYPDRMSPSGKSKSRLMDVSKKALVNFIQSAPTVAPMSVPFLKNVGSYSSKNKEKYDENDENDENDEDENRNMNMRRGPFEGDLERQIDVSFRPILHPTSFNEKTGEVSVQVDLVMNKTNQNQNQNQNQNAGKKQKSKK